MTTYEDAESAASFLKKRVPSTPLVGIICGSGLGKLAEKVENAIVIPYTDIKEFPLSTGKHSQ